MVIDGGQSACSHGGFSNCRLFVLWNYIFHYAVFLVLFRTLSTSDDVEDRETEKGRLEEAYEKCDRDLDQLIVQHYTELTTAIRTYQSITERITSSRNKIKQVKGYAWQTVMSRFFFLLMSFCLYVLITWSSAEKYHWNNKAIN